MTQRVWIFDLDDTLHDASTHIFPVMNRAMTHYMMHSLDLDETAAFKLRQHYWQVYGATLKGLIRHHGTDPHHFLNKTHELNDLPNMVTATKGLRHTIQSLPGRKIIFTNAPIDYAMRVLRLLGIHDIFETVFSIESTQLHPKPSTRGFARLLSTIKASPKNCIMIEDSLPALMTAKRMGMKTVYISKQLHKPNYVDYRINSVLALTRVIR